jgi:hypothetical protein
VRRILGRQQRQVLSIEADAIEVDEIRIAALLFTDAEKVDEAIPLIHSQGFRDIAFA